MWLTNSSIGRKLVMSITGACLILFVTFHVLMNAVAIFWPVAYNEICNFLGANWYALIASAGLAALFIIHIIYAVWLTLQNRRARGNDRYNVVSKPPQVEWASQNMLVLGIVILAFLVVHMIQFWAKMQLAEIMGCHGEIPAQAGTLFIEAAFSCWVTPVVYIIGFIALWFHMTHGFYVPVCRLEQRHMAAAPEMHRQLVGYHRCWSVYYPGCCVHYQCSEGHLQQLPRSQGSV